jgi:ribosomal-protein-alanine N-acetyltransferase
VTRAWTLRPYAPADFEALYNIDTACFAPGIAYPKRALRTFLRQPGAICIVADSANQIAGFILVESLAVSGGQVQGHIITLDVLEQHRRSGVGSALLTAAERALAERSARRIELETAIDNAPAIAFWKKHGYRTIGVVEGYYLDRIDAYWMQKTLG